MPPPRSGALTPHDTPPEVAAGHFFALASRSIWSVTLLPGCGATVALNDQKPLREWSQAALDLKTEGVGLIAGDAPSWLLDQIDLVVVSPGVPVAGHGSGATFVLDFGHVG